MSSSDAFIAVVIKMMVFVFIFGFGLLVPNILIALMNTLSSGSIGVGMGLEGSNLIKVGI